MRRRLPQRLPHIVATPGVYWVVLALSLLPALFWLVDASVRIPQAPMRERLAHWEALEPHHYRYTVTVHCFCLRPAYGPQTVEVRAGKVVAATALRDGRRIDLMPHHFVSIRHLFEALIDAAGRPAQRIEVDFDPAFGFPRRIQIDRITDAYDDELGYTITEFRVLP